MKLFHDEKGALSAARVYLCSCLTYQAFYIPIARNDESLGLVLTFFTALDTSFIVWAAGPRIAQYLAPAAGKMVQGVADAGRALAEKVQSRRDAKAGYEDTP